ncbi:TetR family transcriptional regulator [Kocuria indica]|uniref:TetR family transcriptional regulator n=1 Tax=Kocuria marina subsp. indica TaxID=1049583 RepID=A0A6N9R2T2_9MICC|nr:TetR/AcrR family transcriptional regulator [Kocuria indica]NDO78931.1 TetR family transcriptional regulator [Kocuria indica]
MTPAADSNARQRRFLNRRRELLNTALRLAEDEGWEAVTTRRLAEAIDYSQPVIYQHFENRDDLIRTLVIEGFIDLTNRIESVARSSSATPLQDLCRVYIDFGTSQPRLYEAMFTLPTAVPFADDDTPAEMRKAFDALAAIIASEAPEADAQGTAELYWACCHGLVTLLNARRVPHERIEHHVRRVAEIVRLDETV